MGASTRKAEAESHPGTQVRLDALLRTAVDAIITTDENGVIESFNPAAESMFGWPAREVIGRNVSILMPERYSKRHDAYMRAHEHAGKQKVIGRTREISAKRADGSEFPIELALSAVSVGAERIFTGIIRDISRRREAEARLEAHRDQLEQVVADRTAALEATNRRLEYAKSNLQQANDQLEELVRVDELTGIANRRALHERLSEEWKRMRRERRPISVLICDVDHFKKYNDYYGHPAGDECLRRIAGALANCFQRASEFPARHGGEEFAVVMAGLPFAEAAERGEALLRAIRSLRIAHQGAGEGRFVTASAGVASVVPDASLDAEVLVAAADAALYRAKKAGRDRLMLACPHDRAVAEHASERVSGCSLGTVCNAPD